MHYIVFDLEWNQPSTDREALREPIYFTDEIIEIGAVKLDEHFRTVDEFRIHILPKFFPRMHKQIAALTGIRDQYLAKYGVPFPQAYQQFVSWCGEDHAFMTWSLSDLPVLTDNLRMHGLSTTSLPMCFDLQRIFSREMLRSNNLCSLDHALEILRERGDTAHDALNDARNTVKVANHLDLEQYLQEYGSRVYPLAPISKTYPTHRELVEDPEMQVFTCPCCGEVLTGEGWVNSGNSTYLTYGQCDLAEYLLQLEVLRCGVEEYRCRRTVFELSDDLWDIYMDRKEALGV